jgi:aspartate carbamoyltransferase catalytic subunit
MESIRATIGLAMTNTVTQSRLTGQSLIEIERLSKDDIDEILDLALYLKENPKQSALNGLLLGSCFFEPSTRTRLSFEAAMLRMGGQVIGFSETQSTSIVKGESLADTMRVLGSYVDVLTIRHPHEGAARVAADFAGVPVINAGDGANQHPTQALIDLFAIRQTQKTLAHLQIGFILDLKHARTVHSLALASAQYGSRLYFIADHNCQVPKSICDYLRERGIRFSFHEKLEDVLPRLDILYCVREQVERSEQRMLNQQWVLTLDKLRGAKENLKILHPLPRLTELHPEVDDSPYANYFQQAADGIHVRKALFTLILGKMEALS